MAGTLKRIGPLALTNTYTTNIYNQASALIFDVLTRLRVVNKGAAAATFRLWLGATGANAAGTEIAYDISVPVGGEWNWYGEKKLLSTDFLVGGASAATTLTLEGETEQSVV